MPRRGGPANKYGNRYEDRWTAHCALRLLAGEADTIYLEGPNSEEGFEFSMEIPGAPEFHQVKRQRTGEGHWTLQALDDLGVLDSFLRKLREPKVRCVFASAHAADSLDELCDWAQKFNEWEKFEQQLDTRLKWKGNFEDLRKRWDVSGEKTWEALLRIRVATIGEPELLSTTRLQAELYLTGHSQAETAVADLVDILRDEVDCQLDATGLWSRLSERGYCPSALRPGFSSSEEIVAANERFKATRRATLIDGRLIERKEARALLDKLQEHRVVFLHGEAGAGKSDVIFQFCELLDDGSSPYLAVRLDRQDATRSAAELGEAMKLPGSPAAVLAGCAGEEPAYLIVDQLDALSSSSGRNTHFFEAVAETISMALSDPRMRVVLSCRTFDAENDSRLRQLASGEDSETPEVLVGRLPDETLSKVLGEIGVDRDQLRPNLVELLHLPAHLALLAQIVKQGTDETEQIRGLQDLYESYWRVKQREVEEASGRLEWTEVIDRLVDHMSEHQALVAPDSLADEFAATREAMISAGVLVEDRSQLAFFHETFFDYAYARRFVARGGTLEELLRIDQFLFRRAQVRQILDYTRRATPQSYLENLRLLIGADWVRFHLKELVLVWLGNLPQVEPEEWGLLGPLLDGTDEALKARAQNAIASPGWFDQLDSQGLLERWLGDEELRDRALLCFVGAVDERAARVVELLDPYKEQKGAWRDRISGLLRRADLQSSRELVDFQLARIESGVAGDGEFWASTYTLKEAHPDWVCELLGAYLRDRLRAAAAAGVVNPFDSEAKLIPDDLYIEELIQEAAEKAPGQFVDEVWPVVVEMVERAAEDAGQDDRLRPDPIWRLRHFGDVYADFEEHLMLALETALQGVAVSDPGCIKRLVAEQEKTDIESLVAFLYVGFGANPEALADTAIEFLLADPRRFQVPYSDGSHWATRKMLEAITPRASDEVLERLERPLLDYFTWWEKTANGRRGRGMAQFTLLCGIAVERRSVAVERRIAEWQRKFDQTDGNPPYGIRVGSVQSPIPQEKAAKMSDANWLSAINRYKGDGFEERIDFAKGDARELSRVLEAEAKKDPERFARLATKLTDDAKFAYYEALLRGVGESDEEIPEEACAALVKRCHALPGRPCGQWIAKPLTQRAGEPIDPELLEIVGWYAINGDAESGIKIGSNPGKRDRQMISLNSVRGSIAYAIAEIVAGNIANIEPLESAIESLLADSSLAIREAAMQIPPAMLRQDEEGALAAFLAGVEGADDLVLASPGAHEFMRYRADQFVEQVQPVIHRMLGSEVAEVRNAGATQTALLALVRPEAKSLFEKCLAGEAPLRLGVARVAAANFNSARFRALCEDALFALFDDPDADVRKQASNVMRGLHRGDISAADELMRRFISSQAFRDEPELALLAMHEEIVPDTRLALDAAEAVIITIEAPSDVTRRDGMTARWANEVLMKIYTVAGENELKNRALDLFDQSLRSGVYGAWRELEKHDRP